MTFHLGKSLIEDVLKVTSTIDNPFGANTVLQRAVREGVLRKATASDLSAWRDAYLTNKYTKKNLSVPDGEDAMIGTVEVSNAYVVLAKFGLPWGTSGTNRAVFFVPKGAPFPAGEIGLSAIYDFETLRATCTAARTGSFSC